MALIFCLVMALCGNKMLFIILSLLYGIVNVGMSILTVLKEKKKYLHYLLLPFIFISLHVSYGIGTIIGLLKMPSWKKKIAKNEKI